MAKLLTVHISKKRWYRGKGGNTSSLRLTNGQQCCIGFLARKLGAKVKDIEKRTTLDFVNNTACQEFNHPNESTLRVAYEINDDPDRTDIERMALLRQLGKEINVRFVFEP